MERIYAALKKVYAIPPPIRIKSTLSINCSMIKILSETLAPPIIAVTGLSPPFNTLSAFTNSASITYPKHFSSKYFATIVVDACAR